MMNRCHASNRTGRSQATWVAGAMIALCLAATEGLAGPVTSQQRNVVPALYSYDAILAYTGMAYGIDPAHPSFDMTGTLDDAGFSWRVDANYLGQPFSFRANGTWMSATQSTDWTGSGHLGATSLTISGTTHWTSDVDFAIEDQIGVNGTPTFWSIDTMGQPGANTGTMIITGDPPPVGLHVRDDYILIRELETRHFWSFITGTVTDGWIIKVSDDGNITTNVYSLNREGSSVGVVLTPAGPGGTINFGGQTISKAGLIKRVPGPSSLVTLLAGLLLLGSHLFGGHLAERRRRWAMTN